MPQWIMDAWGAIKASPWIKGGALLSLATAAFVLGGRAGWYGSSSLAVTPLGAAKGVPTGVVYYLPQTVVDVTLTFRVTQCDARLSADNKAEVYVDGTVSVEVKTSNEPDLAHGYVVSGASMDGAHWRTDLVIELSRSMLKSLNSVSASELTPPAGADIGAVVRQIFNETPTSPQASAPSPTDLAKLREVVCGPGLVAAVANSGTPDPKAGEPYLLKRTFRMLPGEPCPIGLESGDVSSPQICTLSGLNSIGSLLSAPQEVQAGLGKFTVEVRLTDKVRSKDAGKVTGEAKGIVYRLPGAAALAVCLVNCYEDGGRLLLERHLSVAQFGAEVIVPAERRLFSDRTTKLEFGDTGELNKASFNDARSANAK